MSTKRGKLIALYGINKTGKSTQTKLLVRRIRQRGHRGIFGFLARLLRLGWKVLYLKYPLYDLEPTGPAINAYFREGNPEGWSPTQLQNATTMNRLAYDPTLRETLAGGTHVVCEDYRGTGLAWGIAGGVDEARLRKINEPLVDEDVVVLFDGEPFESGHEDGHMHEEDKEKTQRARAAFLRLADELGWHIVQSDQSREEVAEQIWDIIKPVVSEGAS